METSIEKNNYYIFPVQEIEYHIISFLDPIIDIHKLLLLNKYYYNLFTNDKFFSQLRIFFTARDAKRGYEDNFIRACTYNTEIAKILYHRYQYSYQTITQALRSACHHGNIDTIKWLHQNGEVYCHIHLILKEACVNNKIEIFDWLLKKFCDESKNAISMYFDEIFENVCSLGYLKIAKRLYRIKNSNKNKNNHKITLGFINACKSGNLKLVKWLYNVSTKNGTPIDIHLCNEEAFRNACIMGHIDIAFWLFQLGIDSGSMIKVSHIRKDFLYHILNNGHVGILKWLIDTIRIYKIPHESLFEAKYWFGYFIIACKNGNIHEMKWLYKMIKNDNNCNIECKRNISIFFEAVCKSGNIESIQWLYRLIDKNKYQVKFNIGTFANICLQGNIELAKWIYKIGKNKWNLCSEDSLNLAFVKSCEGGNLELVKWILKKSQLISHEISSKDYMDSFINACIMNHYHIIRYLYHINKKVCGSFGTNTFNRSFLYACKNGNTEMAKWIYRVGTKLNNPVNIHVNYEEPFIIACINNNIELAKWLYYTGVKTISQICIRINHDKAFKYAFLYGHEQIVMWLCSICPEYSYIVLDDNYLCFINGKKIEKK